MPLPNPIRLWRSEASDVLNALEGAQQLVGGTDYLVALLGIELAAFLLVDRLYPPGGPAHA